MRLKTFCFLDNKTGHFSPPFFMNHVGAAVRAAIDLGGDLSTQIGRHPADFVLCQLAEFDDQTGAFYSEGVLQIGSVLSLLPRQSQPDLLGAAPHRNGSAEPPTSDLGKEY